MWGVFGKRKIDGGIEGMTLASKHGHMHIQTT